MARHTFHQLLFEEGLAFRALPSHDAQSIAGILSTDVHGTGNVLGMGKEWGFVSQSVVSLKLIDGRGATYTNAGRRTTSSRQQ